jgi:predicted DNA-binding protein
MPLCGFDAKMLKGITLFSQSLYEAALRKSREKAVSIEKAMDEEIREMNEFLLALDREYERLRKGHDVPEAMSRLVEWGKERRC